MLILSLYSVEWRHQISPQGVSMLWVSALFAYPLLLIRFVDDARALSVQFKFAAYSALAIAAAWLIGVVDELRVGDLVVTLPFVVALFGTALWVFTLLNVVNFMDGANGMAMGSMTVGLCALSVFALDGNSVAAAPSRFAAPARWRDFWFGIFQAGGCSPGIPARCLPARWRRLDASS